MNIVALIREGSEIVRDEKMEVFAFSNPDAIEGDVYLKSSAIVLDCTDNHTARKIISKIRSFDHENIYLKPVFLVSDTEINDPGLISLADGMADPAAPSRIGSMVRAFEERIGRLEPLTSGAFDTNLLVRILRNMFTRDKPLAPVLDKGSRLGYTYSLIAVNFSGDDEHRIFEVLELGEKEGLLEGTYVDRIHLCDKCFSAFLSLREVCPKCETSDLKSEDLIHHFICAYVGPESDFKKEGREEMVCPKCSRIVRHIGVDYDKPAAIYTCNRCADRFQETKVKAFCFSCRNDTLVENLIEKQIKNYRLTTKGEYAAIYGVTISMKDVIRIPGVVDFEVFRSLLHYEVERLKRVERPGSVGYLQFANFVDLYLRGATKEKIFSEMVELIKQSVRPSDIISYLNEASLLFFFSDTPRESAAIPIERLKTNLIKLVHDNFSGFKTTVHVGVVPLHKDFNLNNDVINIIPSPADSR